MQTVVRLLIFILFTSFISSCATIIYGSRQKIHVNSTPEGAEVRINKKLVGTTPLDIKVSRIKPTTYEFYHPDYGAQVLIAKKKKDEHTLALVLDMAFWIGPVNPAFLIDLITGALLEIDESKLSPNLSDSTLFYSKNIQAENKMLAYSQELRRIRRDSLIIQHEKEIKFKEQARWLKTARKDSILEIKQEQQFQLRSTLKNEISIPISSFISREFTFSYLRYLSGGKYAVGMELGYKPANLFTSTHYYENINFSNTNSPTFLDVRGSTNAIRIMPFAESKYLGIVSKMYILKPNPFSMYLSLITTYRESSYTNATVDWIERRTYENNVYKSDSLDAQQTVKGLKLLFGFSYFKALNSKSALCFDLYSGFGYSHVSNHLFHYNYYFFDSYSRSTNQLAKNQAENTSQDTPTFHLGFKIGLRF